MSRESTAQLAIPAKGSESVPYATHREIVQGLLKHGDESFAVELTGAGGVGASFVCPFEPAEVEAYDTAATIIAQKLVQGSSGPVNINLLTGAPAAADITVAAVDVDDKSLGFTVTLPTGVAADGKTLHVICRGYRDTAGSL